jgi:carbon storage regulator
MLVLTRRTGETICLGDDIEIEVLEARPGVVRLGVRAPKSVRVLRAELVAEVAKTNNQSVVTADLAAVTGLKSDPAPVRRNGRQ